METIVDLGEVPALLNRIMALMLDEDNLKKYQAGPFDLLDMGLSEEDHKMVLDLIVAHATSKALGVSDA